MLDIQFHCQGLPIGHVTDKSREGGFVPGVSEAVNQHRVQKGIILSVKRGALRFGIEMLSSA